MTVVSHQIVKHQGLGRGFENRRTQCSNWVSVLLLRSCVRYLILTGELFSRNSLCRGLTDCAGAKMLFSSSLLFLNIETAVRTELLGASLSSWSTRVSILTTRSPICRLLSRDGVITSGCSWPTHLAPRLEQRRQMLSVGDLKTHLILRFLHSQQLRVPFRTFRLCLGTEDGPVASRAPSADPEVEAASEVDMT
jgi:hypothetical protein